jgi:hypothetical protein
VEMNLEGLPRHDLELMCGRQLLPPG